MSVSMKTIPWAMIWLRAGLCPAIAWAAHRGWDGRWLGAIVLLGLVDDILDGMIARRMECDTPALRLWDSVADTIFYLGVASAVWIREPQLLRESAAALFVLLALEALRYGFDFWKFGKGASYHSYLAKAWGLLIALAVIGVLSFGGLRSLVAVAIYMGILVNLEGLSMSLLLPMWKNDVKTLPIAWKIRKTTLQQARSLRP